MSCASQCAGASAPVGTRRALREDAADMALLLHGATVADPGPSPVIPSVRRFDACGPTVESPQGAGWQPKAADIFHGASRWTIRDRVLLAETVST